MKLNHKILIFKNFFLDKYFLSRKVLRILNYHHIPDKDLKNFEKQIQFYLNNYEIISPKDFENIKKNNFNSKKILLTFDDGLKSIIKILPILEKYGVKAIFFIILDFVNLERQSEIKNFLKQNILIKDKLILSSESNLNIFDIKEIINMGHTIGYHTKSHLNLGSNVSSEIINNEVENSVYELQNKLGGIKINHFAFPFGLSKNITKKSLKILKNRYNFIYSGIRGNNYPLLNQKNPLLKRDEISPHYNERLIKSMLNGAADFYYNRMYNSIFK